MYIFQADQLSAKDTYKLLSGTVIPRPIAFVTTLSSEGAVNAAPFSFYNVVSSDPPLLSISVNRTEGRQKIQRETQWRTENLSFMSVMKPSLKISMKQPQA